ncbi:hypothetical protein CBR_g12133 [Chara braunii]|uniref:Integrase catalytic domain-containing protein n=1 Tax=Chara braunii TaxID=69332 RepID=A0A388KRK1_CHABU|nr:hypothetical protein CBR_g12133 [Chara braunii]|eukprot:GBG72563.1 hypothetical protein CBR_g12133 [Chara braunii]
MRVLCDPEERRAVIEELHNGVVGGHRGVKGTFDKVRRLYWWGGQYTEVEKYCSTREACQKRATVRYKEPLVPLLLTVPGEKVHVDLGTMPKGVGGLRYIINARGDLSGFVEAKAIKKKTAEEVSDFLLEYVARYGCVGKIVMDRGAKFLSQKVKVLLEKAGIGAAHTIAYHPQSNAPVERGHQTLVDALAKWCKGRTEQWSRYLRYAVWADNITVKSSTGYPPYTLWFGRHCPLPIEFHVDTWTSVSWKTNMTRIELLEALIQQIAENLDTEVTKAGENIEREMVKGKDRWDKNLRVRKAPIRVNDLVLMYDSSLEKTWSRKLANQWMGPYKVLKRLDGGAYMLAELDGSRLRDPVVGARLKIFRSRETLGEEPGRKGKEAIGTEEGGLKRRKAQGTEGEKGASSLPTRSEERGKVTEASGTDLEKEGEGSNAGGISPEDSEEESAQSLQWLREYVNKVKREREHAFDIQAVCLKHAEKSQTSGKRGMLGGVGTSNNQFDALRKVKAEEVSEYTAFRYAEKKRAREQVEATTAQETPQSPTGEEDTRSQQSEQKRQSPQAFSPLIVKLAATASLKSGMKWRPWRTVTAVPYSVLAGSCLPAELTAVSVAQLVKSGMLDGDGDLDTMTFPVDWDRFYRSEDSDNDLRDWQSDMEKDEEVQGKMMGGTNEDKEGTSGTEGQGMSIDREASLTLEEGGLGVDRMGENTGGDAPA